MDTSNRILTYLGVSWLIGLCYFFPKSSNYLSYYHCDAYSALICVLVSMTAAISFSVLLLPLYPVFSAGRRSLAHAGAAIVALSFLSGITTALMSFLG